MDDTLFFGKDGKKIDEVIKKLEDKGFTLTREDTQGNVFAFLGVELSKINNNEIVLSQQHLIKKVLETMGMDQCNPRATPCIIDSLGTDADGYLFSESWNYASVAGMLMYLCSNAYPENTVCCTLVCKIHPLS